MSRFFFHVHDGQSWIDEHGAELPSLTAARIFAADYAAGLLKELPLEFWNGAEWRLEIANENGLTLATLQFLSLDAPAAGTTRPAPNEAS